MIQAGDRKFYSLLYRRSNSQYSPDYAKGYRESDERGKTEESHIFYYKTIRTLAESFSYPITALDLGCGTGRYFHCLKNPRILVGVDSSLNMLEHAKAPVYGGTKSVSLIQGSLYDIEFKPNSFDFVMCVGVFGNWCPLDDFIVSKIARFTKPGGVLYLTVVEYVPGNPTWRSNVAKAIEPFSIGPLKRHINAKLGQFLMDERRLNELTQRHFSDVTVTRRGNPNWRVDLLCQAVK
jgi:SAM-dependent methyltransferase